MSKRFTETTKWADPWFRNLSPRHKCLWLWLCDNCDCAGVIQEIDWGLVSFQIGEQCSEADLSGFAERLEKCGNGYWLSKFVVFQYGYINCKEPSMPQRGVLKALQRAGIRFEKAFKRVSKDFQKGFKTLKDKDKEEVKTDPVKEPILPSPEELIYCAYPRKIGKGAALKAIGKALARGHSQQLLVERAQAYAAATATWPAEDRQFIPHPATWFSQDRFQDDPAEWSRKPQTNGQAFAGYRTKVHYD